jgi:D-glycero-D-manno-heptose 1,7-bisphosphate phosphatase
MGSGPAAGRVAAFLDRDGVLNESVVRDGKPRPPASVDDIVIRPGVRSACNSLRDAGVLLLVVTNQPDIARGKATWDEVDAINQHLITELGLDAALVCPHDDADGCSCRKPKPGLLLQGAERFGVDLARSVMVGDRWRDIDAGRNAGVTTVWLRSDYPEGAPDAPDHTVDGLAEVVPLLIPALTVEEDSLR